MTLYQPTYPGADVDFAATLQGIIDGATFGDTIHFRNAANGGGDVWTLVSPTSGGAPLTPIAAVEITVSGLTFLFDDDAYLLAAEDSFHPVYCSMLQATNQTDLSFIFGNAASGIRMRRADYLGPFDQPGDTNINGYVVSEFRHCLALTECDDTYIQKGGFRLSGGDGLYLGGKLDSGTSALKTPCRRTTVVDSLFDENMRQGVSCTSVDGLYMLRCGFNGSSGRAPQSGIDFEPYHPMASLKDIMLVDCYGNDDASRIYFINTGGMIATAGSYPRASHPIDITIKQSISSHTSMNTRGLDCNCNEGSPPSGTVRLVGWRVTDVPRAGILCNWHVDCGFQLIFDDCVIDSVATLMDFPIWIALYGEGTGSETGGIYFNRQRVIDTEDRKIVDLDHDATSGTTTSSGSSTTLVDTARTEANDYWNGKSVTILSGACAGETRTVLDFDSATDTVTVSSAFSATIASGVSYKIGSRSAEGPANCLHGEIFLTPDGYTPAVVQYDSNTPNLHYGPYVEGAVDVNRLLSLT